MNLPLFFLDKLSEIHSLDGIMLYQDHYINDQIDDIIKDIHWRNDEIKMYGKTYPQPRLTAWHGDPGIQYTYSHIKMIANGWTPRLKSIRDKLESDLQTPFNSVLINLYRDGSDHMSYHADDEPSLGINPTIASLSFGVTRNFFLKHRYDKNIPTKIYALKDQSLLVMKEELQHFWFHKISKSTKIKDPRLNLTFRHIKNLS